MGRSICLSVFFKLSVCESVFLCKLVCVGFIYLTLCLSASAHAFVSEETLILSAPLPQVWHLRALQGVGGGGLRRSAARQRKCNPPPLGRHQQQDRLGQVSHLDRVRGWGWQWLRG